MRSSISSLLGASIALAMLEAAAEPGPAPERAAHRRQPSTPKQPKAPTTSYDLTRLEAAERKRARKAAALAMLLAPGERKAVG